jgi:hypothetical protein
MTETEWLHSPAADYAPYRMLDFLQEEGIPRRASGRRRLRLFACGCCRWVWHLLGEEHRWLVEAVEQWADEHAGTKELRAIALAERDGTRLGYNEHEAAFAAEELVRSNAAHAVRQVLFHAFNAHTRDPVTPGVADREKWAQAERFFCTLFRDLFGNPFRPPPQIDPAWLAWNDGTVVKLARAIYDDRAFDRLGILADALEDAGCTDDAILNHCRDGAVHARGCWLIDRLLDKR